MTADASTALEVYRVLTVRQPWADLIMAGVKDVENRTWPVPSTVLRCPTCDGRPGSWRSTIRFDGSDIPTGLGHTPCPWCDDTPPEEYAEEAFPFRLWIHAGKQPDRSDAARDAWLRSYPVYSGPLPLGVLLGSVDVTGCHHADECVTCACVNGRDDERCLRDEHVDRYCSRWAEPDGYHWTLTDPEPLDEPIPAKGRLGLWTLPDDIAIPA